MFKRFYLLFLSLLIVMWLVYSHTVGKKEIKHKYQEEIKSGFAGKVLKIVQDTNNHPTSTIYFSDGYIFKGIEKHSYGLWVGLNIDDSVIKKADDKYYIRIRPKYSFIIDTFKIPNIK